MTNIALVRQKHALDALVAKVSAFDSDIELQSHWAKYLCILISGFLENSVKELYGAYLAASSSPASAKWGTHHLKQIRNPKSQKLVDIARTFSDSIATKLETYLEEDGRKDAIDSIMNHRHHIAHGKSSDLTLAYLKQYWAKSLAVVDHTETILSSGPV